MSKHIETNQQLPAPTQPKGDIRHISVIVPAFNEITKLPNLVASLAGQQVPDGVNMHLVISDNGSTDGTQAYGQRVGTIVEGSKPKSIGSARRFGVMKALQTADVADENHLFIFTDADTRLGPDYIASVYRAFNRNPQLMVSTGPAEYEARSGGILPKSLRAPARFGRKLMLARLFKTNNRKAKDFIKPPYEFFPGYNMAVRASAYNMTPGFSDEIPSGVDLDISLKLRRVVEPEQIAFNPQQLVQVSARTFLTPRGTFSLRKIYREVMGHHVPHQQQGGRPNFAVVTKHFIDSLEVAAYNLSAGERVVAMGTKRKIRRYMRGTYRMLQAVRPVDGKKLRGKYVIVGNASA